MCGSCAALLLLLRVPSLSLLFGPVWHVPSLCTRVPVFGLALCGSHRSVVLLMTSSRDTLVSVMNVSLRNSKQDRGLCDEMCRSVCEVLGSLKCYLPMATLFGIVDS